MNKYEAMFIINADLDEAGTSALTDQVKEVITKNQGNIISSRVWAEKRRLCYTIKRKQEATYYLVNFRLQPADIDKLRQIYRMNENIMRFLIIRIE